jgi:transcriptional regulator with XRE-family HTH domain
MAKHQQRVAARKEVGARIRQLCAARGLSMAEAGLLAGLCSNHLSQIVSGRNKRPTGRTLLKIARVLGVGPITTDRARIEPELEAARRGAGFWKR